MAFDAVLSRMHRASRAGCGCACTRTHGVGAVERANPLPPGRYWVDVFELDSPNFSTWLATNKATVRIVSTEHHDADSGGPARDWVLFEVSAATPWNGPGLPTIADPSVTSSSDTVQRPDPSPDVSTTLEQGIERLGASSTGWIAAALAGGVLVLLLTRRGG